MAAIHSSELISVRAGSVTIDENQSRCFRMDATWCKSTQPTNDDNAADSYALARLAAGIATDSVEKSIVEQIKDPKYRDN